VELTLCLSAFFSPAYCSGSAILIDFVETYLRDFMGLPLAGDACNASCSSRYSGMPAKSGFSSTLPLASVSGAITTHFELLLAIGPRYVGEPKRCCEFLLSCPSGFIFATWVASRGPYFSQVKQSGPVSY